MDLSNLKMTLKAYQRVSKSVLSDYVTKEQIELLLDGYVEEVPIGAPEGTAYARQYKKWVKIDISYMKPTILTFELVGLDNHYSIGDTVSISGLIHQESDIKYLADGKIRLYRDDILLLETDASEDLVTIPVNDSFILTPTGAIYKLEMESAMGNTYNKKIVVKSSSVGYMHWGPLNVREITQEQILALPVDEIVEGAKYRYNLEIDSYMWFCSTVELDGIYQDGTFPIDTVRSETIIDGVKYYCYRSFDMLVVNTWRFTFRETRPEPPVEVGDLRIGGSVVEEMTPEAIVDLTLKDYDENTIYKINTTMASYVWVCCKYEVDIMDTTGSYPDFSLVDVGVEADGNSYYCYRSNDVLVPYRWQFKLEKI